jgi:cyclophilin family peptidyl-prolyl cis-trans isomerase
LSHVLSFDSGPHAQRSPRRAAWIAAALLLVTLTACGRSDEPTPAPTTAAAATAATATMAAGDSPIVAVDPVVKLTATPAADTANAAALPTAPPPVIENPGPAGKLAPAERDAMYDAPPEFVLDPDSYYYATIKTNRGDIKVQLFADRAPNAVNSFIFLAREGFYDNTTFHRVLDGFMAQGGDPTGTGGGGPGYMFDNESYPGLVFDQAGLLAMANSGPDTNGSQFFITFGPADWLDGGYTIFGKVIEGEDVLGRLTRRDPDAAPDFAGDTIYTVIVEELDTSILPTPTPAPPTATPTPTPTAYAPTQAEGDRPLAELPSVARVNLFNQPPEMVITTTVQYTATFRTSKGDFVAQLFADRAPIAVNNFVVLANLGFYDQTPISLVQPNDSIIIGAPDNNPLNDAGYRLRAETGTIVETDIGAITYIPMQQADDGAILSSSSQLLIALVQPPAAANQQFPFFAQVVDGVDVLPQLTTDDTIVAVEITSSAD